MNSWFMAIEMVSFVRLPNAPLLLLRLSAAQCDQIWNVRHAPNMLSCATALTAMHSWILGVKSNPNLFLFAFSGALCAIRDHFVYLHHGHSVTAVALNQCNIISSTHKTHAKNKHMQQLYYRAYPRI